MILSFLNKVAHADYILTRLVPGRTVELGKIIRLEESVESG